MAKHRKVTTMGFSFNKALGAGVGGLVFGAVGPMLLGVLNFVHPIAGAFNPALGALVGLAAAAVTWFTPKNAPKTVERN